MTTFAKVHQEGKKGGQILRELLIKYDPKDTLGYQADESIMSSLDNRIAQMAVVFNHAFVELIAIDFVDSGKDRIMVLDNKKKRLLVRKTMRYILQTAVMQTDPAKYMEKFLTPPDAFDKFKVKKHK